MEATARRTNPLMRGVYAAGAFLGSERARLRHAEVLVENNTGGFWGRRRTENAGGTFYIFMKKAQNYEETIRMAGKAIEAYERIPKEKRTWKVIERIGECAVEMARALIRTDRLDEAQSSLFKAINACDQLDELTKKAQEEGRPGIAEEIRRREKLLGIDAKIVSMELREKIARNADRSGL